LAVVTNNNGRMLGKAAGQQGHYWESSNIAREENSVPPPSTRQAAAASPGSGPVLVSLFLYFWVFPTVYKVWFITPSASHNLHQSKSIFKICWVN